MPNSTITVTTNDDDLNLFIRAKVSNKFFVYRLQRLPMIPSVYLITAIIVDFSESLRATEVCPVILFHPDFFFFFNRVWLIGCRRRDKGDIVRVLDHDW